MGECSSTSLVPDSLNVNSHSTRQRQTNEVGDNGLSKPFEIIEVIGDTIGSSVSLHDTVKRFGNQTRAKWLNNELHELKDALQSLKNYVETYDEPFQRLEEPLRQCSASIKHFTGFLDIFLKDSDIAGSLQIKWAELRYLGSDVVKFVDRLAVYKVMTKIALEDVKSRDPKTTVDTDMLVNMIKDTQADLQTQLVHLKQRFDLAAQRESATLFSPAIDNQTTQDYQDSNKECTTYCREVLKRIDSMKVNVVSLGAPPDQKSTAPIISTNDLAAPNALTLSTLENCSNMIRETLAQLDGYEQRPRNEAVMPTHVGFETDWQRWQAEITSMEQCLELCEDVLQRQRASQTPTHVFENIRTGNNSMQVYTVTNPDYCLSVRNAKAGDNSTQIFGYHGGM